MGTKLPHDALRPPTMDAAYLLFSGEDAHSGGHDPVYLSFRAGWLAYARNLERIITDGTFTPGSADAILEHIRNAA